jgi:chloride channel protein, CIC family
VDTSPLSSNSSAGGYRLLLISLLAALIGLAAGVISFLLYRLIGFITNLALLHRISSQFTPAWHEQLGPWLIPVAVGAGVVVGLMAKYGSEKIKGHGIPEAMEAAVIEESRIAPRIAILKPISAAIAIGTGSPFGAEGPIIQTGGAVGSLVGQLLDVTAAERRVLLACGAGAGMAATFNTPISGVVLAIELLLFEFRARSFIPLVIAATLATSTRRDFIGSKTMFTVGQLDFGIPHTLPYYLLLGILCGFAAIAFTKLLYWTEDQFERLPVDSMWWPAIAGIFLGVVGMFVPRVLGVGYDTITEILNGNLLWPLLLELLICKAVVLFITLGSGSSGGLLAPMFMSGAALGGLFAIGINSIVPGAHLSPGAFALVAMAAVFGGAARAAFTLIIFAFEVTGDYRAILPLMLATVIADGIAMWGSPYSIMVEKLAKRGVHIPQDYEPEVFKLIPVEKAMSQDVLTVPPEAKIAQISSRLAMADPAVIGQTGIPIVERDQRLVGILTHEDLTSALQKDPRGQMSALQAGTRNPVVTYPDELLFEAMGKMLLNHIGGLPVVSRDDPRHLLGFLDQSGLLASRRQQFQEELVREPGWLGVFFRRNRERPPDRRKAA